MGPKLVGARRRTGCGRRRTRARVINEPTKLLLFGPAYVVIEDVPTPFALPFGFVPNQITRASGLLIPSFNEEAARGFGLHDWGYYFVFGDHFDASVTADLYSLGSWNLVVESRYKKGINLMELLD